jgi:hypothetical protein
VLNQTDRISFYGAASVSGGFEAVKYDGHHACGGIRNIHRVSAEQGDLRDQLRQRMVKHVA